MHRQLVSACAAALLALCPGGCGGEDDRPATLEYITAAILVPSCAAAQCHSAFVQADGLDFSSVASARRTITENTLVALDARSTGTPEESLLYLVLVSPGGDGFVSRMPWDRPMPDVNVELIRRWIEDGAPGL